MNKNKTYLIFPDPDHQQEPQETIERKCDDVIDLWIMSAQLRAKKDPRKSNPVSDWSSKLLGLQTCDVIL